MNTKYCKQTFDCVGQKFSRENWAEHLGIQETGEDNANQRFREVHTQCIQIMIDLIC